MKNPDANISNRPGAFLLGLLIVWCGCTLSAFGVVDANSRANTNAPPDGSPWTSLGHVSVQPNGNGYSGVYVGAGWVLTAAHVPPGDTDFNGTFFAWDGTSVRMTNSDGTATDMQMFHLRTLPPLPRLPLATSTPADSTPVDLIGFGYIAGSAQTTIGPYTGFYWSAPNQYKSWGNNEVAPGGLVTYDIGLGNVTAFVTSFPAPPFITSDEAQGAPGDSGGGVFHKNGSTWQLVGLIDAIDTYMDQPGNSAVYTNNTYSIDIATYRVQIAAVIAATRPALTISRSGTNVMVCWPDSGVTYSLLANDDLSTTNWALISPGLTYANGQFCALLPATNSPSFFRLKH